MKRSPAPAEPPPRRIHDQHVTLRLDAATIARLDALIPALSTDWREASRSDVLRKVILSGLADIEEHRPPPRAAARPRRGR